MEKSPSYMVKLKKKNLQKWWLYDHFCEMKNNSYASRCNSHTNLCVCVCLCNHIQIYILPLSHLVITEMQLKWPTLDIFIYLIFFLFFFWYFRSIIFFLNLYYFIFYTLMFWMFRAYLGREIIDLLTSFAFLRILKNS